jgi:molybdopterin adenylyltransferase
MKVGRITVSDRAAAGTYEDLSGPEIENTLRQFLDGEAEFVSVIVPDEADLIAAALRNFADARHCDLVITTGGTGIARRDVTPEATRAVLDKELPGFGEAMRAQSFAAVRTALLSRATAGARGRTLIVNLPGKPAAVRLCLQILAPAILEGVAHLRGEDPHAAATCKK